MNHSRSEKLPKTDQSHLARHFRRYSGSNGRSRLPTFTIISLGTHNAGHWAWKLGVTSESQNNPVSTNGVNSAITQNVRRSLPRFCHGAPGSYAVYAVYSDFSSRNDCFHAGKADYGPYAHLSGRLRVSFKLPECRRLSIGTNNSRCRITSVTETPQSVRSKEIEIR